MLSLVLAPLATEMPEKANSVLWVRRGKDALALGNITGAMTFQASIPVALGLVFTTWELDAHALTAAVIGLLGGALARWAIPRRHVGLVPVAVWGDDVLRLRRLRGGDRLARALGRLLGLALARAARTGCCRMAARRGRSACGRRAARGR